MTASSEAATPADREVQRPPPNDPRRRVKEPRPNGAPFESWVNDSSALQGVQRSSPNDSRNGSNSRALTALLESSVNDSRDSSDSNRNAIATPNEAPCGAGEQQTNRTKTGVVSRAQKFPLRLPLAPQASRNTYQTGSHHGGKKETLYDDFSALTKGK